MLSPKAISTAKRVLRTVVGLEPPPDKRIGALRRFAVSITLITVIGHFWLGFELSWAQITVLLSTSYGLELIMEVISAWATRKTPRFRGGVVKFVNFLLPAHISGLSIGLLIYPGDQLWPCVLVSTIAICSKQVFQAPVNGAMRHFMNPSNLAVAFLLTFYTWVGPAPMYQFTEYATGAFKWIIPGIMLGFGTLLNVRLTGRGPLVAAWLGGFLLQDVIRHVLVPSENTLLTPVAMMTGTAFVLFTNYMITDPGSTPSRPRNQMVFGFTAAMVYGALVLSHIVYGLFYCVVITCAIRGAVLWYAAWRKSSSRRPEPQESPSTVLVPAIADGEPALVMRNRKGEFVSGAAHAEEASYAIR